LNKQYDLFKKDKELLRFVEKLIIDGFKEQQVDQIKVNGGYLSIVLVGRNETQIFFGLCLLPEKQVKFKHYLEQLSLFSCNIYGHIYKLILLERDKALVYLDEVSGLYNQRKISLDIEEMNQRYIKTGCRFAVFFIDIDDFKKVNDLHGHVIGTRILKDVAARLRLFFRDNDLLYRYGGDEFIIILPNVDNVDVLGIGQRILKIIRDEKFTIDSTKCKSIDLSVSIGIAIYPDHVQTLGKIISLADKMMYEAKLAGKGKVCMASRVILDMSAKKNNKIKRKKRESSR